MSFEDYLAQEESNSDMFLFLKFVNPILFEKIAVHPVKQEDNETYQSQLNTARLAIEGKVEITPK